jgi:adenylate cyclase
MPPVRRLTAILAADVAGYSRLMGADEEGTHERLKGHLRELVEPKIAEHRGRVVKNTGDGMLAEFSSVVDAVRCAAEVQRAMADRNAETPEDKRITFRVGINLGDVIAEPDDIYGDGVNVAARLEALAEPGGICVSRVVRDQIRDKLPYPFEDKGEQSVKNIARSVRVFALRPEAIAELPVRSMPAGAPRRRRSVPWAVVAAALAAIVFAVVAWWGWSGTRSSSTEPATVAATTTSITQPPTAPRLSIIVLPFSNLSNDPEQQYLADGITEDLTTDLSRIAHMFVISRNTAFTYKDKPINARQLGRELGVRYVLEGSVQRSGNHVRVNAQLIAAETDAHLWAERFDRDMGDLLALQDEITRGIAGALNAELIAAEAARPTEHPDALDYILRGRAVWSGWPTEENYAQAVRLFDQALALDPQSVEAQTWLADVLSLHTLRQRTDRAASDIARAEELVKQALAASPRNAHAHYDKAQILRAQGRCREAIPEFETVISLNPNFGSAYANLGWCKFLTGSIEDVIPLEEKALRLTPRGPFVGTLYLRIGTAHFLQSHYEDAIGWLEKARNATLWPAEERSYLASAYALTGQNERAAAELAEARRMSPDDRYSSITRLRAVENYGALEIRALRETTYFAGLRKAGMPEE